MTKNIILTLFLILNVGLVHAKKHPAEAAREQNLPAVTIFLDISVLGRKDRSAKRMTQMHQEFARFGYTLIDVNTYTENGDLEGFFLSYVSNITVNK